MFFINIFFHNFDTFFSDYMVADHDYVFKNMNSMSKVLIEQIYSEIADLDVRILALKVLTF